MFIRSSHPVLDCAMSMVQGATAAAIYNTFSGKSISPLNAAVGLAATVSLQKLYADKFVHAYIGPIPCGPKDNVSYGLAAITAFKIIPMIAGVLSVPYFVLALSVTGLACYFIGIEPLVIPIMERNCEKIIGDLLKRKAFTNVVLTGCFDTKVFRMRMIINPKGRTVTFSPAGMGSINEKGKLILAADEGIPECILNEIKNQFGEDYSLMTAKINGQSSMQYTQNPVVS